MKVRLTTAQLVSICNGSLLCPMEDIYKALDALTGEKLFTHQLPRAARECTPSLVKQFPWLNDCKAITDTITTDNWKEKLVEIEAAYGTAHDVEAVSTYKPQDPIAELTAMINNKEDGKNE